MAHPGGCGRELTAPCVDAAAGRLDVPIRRLVLTLTDSTNRRVPVGAHRQRILDLAPTQGLTRAEYDMRVADRI